MLTLTNAKGKGEYEQDVKPVSGGAERQLLYNRWLKKREDMVEKYSGGKVGYVHVRSMDTPSFRKVFSRVLGKLRNKGGSRGGHPQQRRRLASQRFGSAAEREAVCHLRTAWSVHGQRSLHALDQAFGGGDESERLLQRPRLPYMYKTLGLGKLVGAPMAGTMTAVWWETQYDGELVVGVPEVAVKDLQGNYLENQTLNPDVEVIPTPEQVLNDDDVQVKRAVDLLLGK